MAFLVAAVAGAEPRPLRVVETTPLSCPSRSEIDDALGRRGLRSQRRAGYTLRLAQEGTETLRIELLGPQGVVNQRRLSTVSGRCATLADTAALVVDAWLRELPWHSAVPHKKPEAPPTIEPAPPPESIATPEPVAAPVDEPGKVPREDPAPDGLAAPATSIGPPVAAPVVVAPPKAPPPPKKRPRLHVDTRIAAGGAFGLSSDTPRTGYGAFAFELSVSERWSVALRAAVASPVDVAHDPGTVEWRRVPLAAYARVVLLRRGPVRLSVHGGLLVDVILARSDGFTTTGAATVVDPGLLAGVGWDWQVNKFIILFVDVRGDLLLRDHTFDIDNLGVVATLPRAWIDLEAGVALRFF